MYPLQTGYSAEHRQHPESEFPGFLLAPVTFAFFLSAAGIIVFVICLSLLRHCFPSNDFIIDPASFSAETL